jgi:serine/threonine protein kinase/Flp pilus assembly protein TadD
MPLSIGERLGPYRIVAWIGAGGMGEVYRARDSRLDRDVAVKIMKDRRPGFEKEARAAAALNHPNIVAVYDVGPDYVVMELVEGDSLRTVLRQGAMLLRDAIEIGGQVADGLAAAHAGRVVHRDLKPENIVLGRDGRPKILDFGLAKRSGISDEKSTFTEPGSIIGTPGYMSPEQVRGQDLDARSDIFSLGLILYEMLTGRRAFLGASAPETMAAIANDRVADLGSGFSPLLQALVMRCLEKDRERRFQSARDLGFSLRSLAASPSKFSNENPTHTSNDFPIDSLAVMPFENTSGNSDGEYLSDGITESLINSLSRISELRVVARSRVFRYKGKEIDPRQAGRDLNVRALLTGRISQRGDSLKVQAELVEAATESQMWGERFHRKLTDIFEVEEEMAEQIARSLRFRLSGEDKDAMVRRYKGNSAAYQRFLQGQYHWKKRTGESLAKAIQCFEESIQLDSTYAMPHAGLACCYLVLVFYNVGDPRVLLAKGKTSAARAVELDPRSGAALATMALLHAWTDWDLDRTNAEVERAIQLDPHDFLIHDWAAFVYATQGRMGEMRREMNKALELDPLALQLQHHAAWFFLLGRQYEQALEQTHRMTELDPSYPLAYLWRGVALERLSRYAEAEDAFRHALALFGGGSLPAFESFLSHCLAVAGRVDESREMLERLERLAQNEYVEPYGLALIYLGLDDPERALGKLEQAVEMRSVYATLQFLSDSRLDGVRSTPRFQKLLHRMGLDSQNHLRDQGR